VIAKKTTAQVRDKDSNPSANGASGEKIVVILLGFKSNHPFGIFTLGFKEMGDYFYRMSVELSEGAADNGCTYFSKHNSSLIPFNSLGPLLPQNWHWPNVQSRSNKDPSSYPELLNISYWRDLESVRAFAHGHLHREAWDYWNWTIKEHDYLGIHHEVYEAEANVCELPAHGAGCDELSEERRGEAGRRRSGGRMGESVAAGQQG
jgi:Domain of unknown function (DUF4188)